MFGLVWVWFAFGWVCGVLVLCCEWSELMGENDEKKKKKKEKMTLSGE